MIFRGTESVAGTNSKSDVLVTVEITTKDGIQIEIISKALKKYGDSICESVKEVLKNFKIENANLLVEDFGALDFVIRARTEAAIMRNITLKEA